MAISRRSFVHTAAALPLAGLLPQSIFGFAPDTIRCVVRLDSEIARIRPELHGHFAEHLGSCVYGGLWVGKNSPIPNVDGYRKEAIEYLSELGVPVLRWPGGCFADDYHWRDGVGPANKRAKRVNIHWGDYVEDNSFGIHEFMGLCRKIGAEPYLAGNVGSGTPAELRDWVEYCNFPSGTTLSDERATNGSPEPFGVRYWGVGNENWGCGGSMTPEHYADQFRQFSGYLRNFGDSRLFLIACGPNGNDIRWSRKFLDQTVGVRLPSGFGMHFYEGGDKPPAEFTADAMQTQMKIFERVEQAILQQRAILDGYDPQHRFLNLILDEWGVWDKISPEVEKQYGKLWQQITMRSAVAAGLGLNMFNRLADKLYMCNIAQIVNVLHSLLLTDGPEGRKCVRTTTYHAFMMFKPHRANTAVRVERDNSDPSRLSVSASKRGSEVVVSFVNPHPSNDVQADCELAGTTPKQATAQILHHADLNAYNSFDNPDNITPQPHPISIDASRLRFTAPALSVITIRVQV